MGDKERQIGKCCNGRQATLMEKASEAYSTKERAELLLLNLQKLRAEVSSIEAHYDILKADYTKICDDAMLKISSIKTDLADALESKIGQLEGTKSEMSGWESRLESGLVPAEIRLKAKEVVHQGVTPAPRSPQAIIDKAADYIEFGLDKIGDVIIFPAERIGNACTAISKNVNWRTKRRTRI